MRIFFPLWITIFAASLLPFSVHAEVDDKPSLHKCSYLNAGARDLLREDFYGDFDSYAGGTRSERKFLYRDYLRYALIGAQRGESHDREIIEITLRNAKALLDPVWGGLYDYSTGSNWNSPIYSKSLSTQAEGIALYASAFAITKNEEFLSIAEKIEDYVSRFLSAPEGAFFYKQEGELKGVVAKEYFSKSDELRRASGIPAVVRTIAIAEVLRMAESLAKLSDVSGKDGPLLKAIRAVEWIEKNHLTSTGGVQISGEELSLSNNIALIGAYIALYRSTGERKWLERAVRAGVFVGDNFIDEGTPLGKKGLLSIHPVSKSLQEKNVPVISADENGDASRVLSLLWRYSGNTRIKEIGEVAWCGASKGADKDFKGEEAALLLTDFEYNQEPLHITVVAPSADPVGRALHKSARAYPASYSRIDWWDPAQGPLINSDVAYPVLKKPAAFVCSNKRCSLPIFEPDKLHYVVSRIDAVNQPTVDAHGKDK